MAPRRCCCATPSARADAADALDAAVEAAIETGPRTADLGGTATTDEVTEFLLERIGAQRGGGRMSAPIVLYDTTLRDGTQREGLVLSWPTS